MLVDRIEWTVMPDQATAAAALQSGEVDWWESPISDLVPLLRRNRNVAVDIADPLGNIGCFRMNHGGIKYQVQRLKKLVDAPCFSSAF
jgi:peptide/nickel transport system substrate-binding protein